MLTPSRYLFSFTVSLWSYYTCRNPLLSMKTKWHLTPFDSDIIKKESCAAGFFSVLFFKFYSDID